MDTIIEKMYPPKWIKDRIASVGGMNPYGKPNFRVVWGGVRTHLVGGMFTKPITTKDEMVIGQSVTVVTRVAEMRTLLKYHSGRWHLERWLGPDKYGTAEDWYTQTWDEEAKLHSQGDYPHEGDYEHVFYLGQCNHMKAGDTEWCQLCKVSMGEYIPLEENYYLLERQIYLLLKTDTVINSPSLQDEERRALFMREDLKRQVFRKNVQQRVEGAMRPKLAVQPTSWQDGTRCSVPEAKMQVKTARPTLGLTQVEETN